MVFDFGSLEPRIYQFLSAPGTDLTTISAKRVRQHLLELDPALTPDFLKENKAPVDEVIASVFERVSGQANEEADETSQKIGHKFRKERDDDDETLEEDYTVGDGGEEEGSPPPKQSKKGSKQGLSTSISRSAILHIFEGYRADIDNNHDRRESLIKASRDITNLSKKAIFLLHRCALVNPSPDQDEKVKNKWAAQQCYEKLCEVQDKFAQLKPALEGDKFWRYQKQIAPALQEYIEALSFAHYLDHGSLISFDAVQGTLQDPNGNQYFPLPVEDYLLGVSDLTGELMRFAISGITRRGGRVKAMEICAFVRECKADFEQFTPYIGELRKKQHVTAQSLEKIEDAVYAIVVRSSEYDLPQEILDDIVSRSISHFGGRPDHGDFNYEEEYC